MEWTKFSDKWPDMPDDILHYDHKTECINLIIKRRDGTYRSTGYYCNNPECCWTFDDCGCPLVISPEDQWMFLPESPDTTKE